MEKPIKQRIVLTPENSHRLANVCGHLDEHLVQIEKHLTVKLGCRGHTFSIEGHPDNVNRAGMLLQRLYEDAAVQPLTPASVHLSLKENAEATPMPVPMVIRTPLQHIKPRTYNQQIFIQRIQNHDVNFGIGPAGTGKTYLAVAAAVAALESENVRRIVLVRPALEAGERLGFLPGDLSEKIDPYLRPLYDALHDMLGFERVQQMLSRGVIELAPLAYMRGRTLNEAFIILDESQNTTIEQMKMFLTRIGFGSKCVITGDTTQIDLPKHRMSGLCHVLKVLKHLEAISFTYFQPNDVVRHHLIQQIVEAYDSYDKASPLAPGACKA